MKISTALFTVALIAGGASASFAQTDTRAAPGVPLPDAPRLTANGGIAPPPSMRANGGVGGTEMPNSGTQTRSGGPAGGQTNTPN